MEMRRLSRAADISHVAGMVTVDAVILLLWSLIPEERAPPKTSHPPPAA